MTRRSVRWWPRMLMVQLGITLSVLTAAAHITQPAAGTGSGGGAPGITTAWFPTTAVQVKPVPREGLRPDRGRHVVFPPPLHPTGSLVWAAVQARTLRPETVHGGFRRSPLHRDIALRAPPFSDRLS